LLQFRHRRSGHYPTPSLASRANANTFSPAAVENRSQCK
jgi:hypothetical protein